MQNDDVISINNTNRSISRQAASESSVTPHQRHRRTIKFVRGAYASRGGKSFICSRRPTNARRRESRVVSTLTPGNIVTTPRTTSCSVSEYGLVNLKGKSVAERAAP